MASMKKIFAFMIVAAIFTTVALASGEEGAAADAKPAADAPAPGGDASAPGGAHEGTPSGSPAGEAAAHGNAAPAEILPALGTVVGVSIFSLVATNYIH